MKPNKKNEAMQRVCDLPSVHVAISRCALAVAIGVVGADPFALAPAPSLFPPQQPFLLSEEYIDGVRLSYISFASTNDVTLQVSS